MRLNCSIFFQSYFFHDQLCERCFYMRFFLCRALHHFTFHNHFARFSYVGRLRNHANQVPSIPHTKYVI